MAMTEIQRRGCRRHTDSTRLPEEGNELRLVHQALARRSRDCLAGRSDSTDAMTVPTSAEFLPELFFLIDQLMVGPRVLAKLHSILRGSAIPDTWRPRCRSSDGLHGTSTPKRKF
jgi:hypothetical protein